MRVSDESNYLRQIVNVIREVFNYTLEEFGVTVTFILMKV